MCRRGCDRVVAFVDEDGIVLGGIETLDNVWEEDEDACGVDGKRRKMGEW